MKFKKYPENKPTKSGDYLVKQEFIIGFEPYYVFQTIEWSNQYQAWNAHDDYEWEEQTVEDALEHAFTDVVGWCEIIDEGYEE